MFFSKLKLSKRLSLLLLALGTAGVVLSLGSAQSQFATSAPPQAQGLNGWHYAPLVTVGDALAGYTPVGIFDGIGAVPGQTVGLSSKVVRILVNHEVGQGVGASYPVNKGSLTIPGGARISYFDLDKITRKVLSAGIAYDVIYDRLGNLISDLSQFHDVNSYESLVRFCSGSAFGMATFGRDSKGKAIGFEDPIYFAGEETNDGTQWVLNIKERELWAVPMMGRGNWENWAELNVGRSDVVALLGGDDYGVSKSNPAPSPPLYLYIGQKGVDAKGNPSNSFLARNGLAKGKLYVWKADRGDKTPQEFKGTGESRTGIWVDLTNQGTGTGFVKGFATAATLRQEAKDKGAFLFSRPEDVTTNPLDGTLAAFTSTGRGSLYSSDNWGKTYSIALDFAFDSNGELDTGRATAFVKILYDGDDAGNGQFSGSDYGLRSPDNLDWANDGFIYVQEDPATQVSQFCATSREAPSIWQIEPKTGKLTRVAQVVPGAPFSYGQSNPAPNACDEWESSGILDVTELFDTKPREKLFLFDVQAHGVTNGNIATENLVQGGQIGFLSITNQSNKLK